MLPATIKPFSHPACPSTPFYSHSSACGPLEHEKLEHHSLAPLEGEPCSGAEHHTFRHLIYSDVNQMPLKSLVYGEEENQAHCVLRVQIPTQQEAQPGTTQTPQQPWYSYRLQHTINTGLKALGLNLLSLLPVLP